MTTEDKQRIQDLFEELYEKYKLKYRHQVVVFHCWNAPGIVKSTADTFTYSNTVGEGHLLKMIRVITRMLQNIIVSFQGVDTE